MAARQSSRYNCGLTFGLPSTATKIFELRNPARGLIFPEPNSTDLLNDHYPR